jgi:hypothetical protein
MNAWLAKPIPLASFIQTRSANQLNCLPQRGIIREPDA